MPNERNPATVPAVRLESDQLRKQQTAFCVLTLFVLAMLLLLHALFAFVLGEPSLPVLGVLGLSFAIRLVELAWLQSDKKAMTERMARLDGAGSILMLFVLAGVLAWLTNRDHSPYQVLLAIPVLQSAFLFGLRTTIVVIASADSLIFLWLWRYFSLHPPPSGAEFLEGGMLAVVFALMGLLVWLLVSQLRTNQLRLSEAFSDLDATRERLTREEKLAAVGRLASGIAHEIRNPVAMIVSALSTASDPATSARERDEMFGIAGRQASRLERLTTDFLSYARPVVPRRAPILLSDLIVGTEGVTRVRAAGKAIQISSRIADEATVILDATQVEGALLNLTVNAVDSVGEAGEVTVFAGVSGGSLRIDVESSGAAIPEVNLARIFEPFFTTKANGTGLGLAIAKSVARAHGGDLWVSRNEDGHVVFTMTLAAEASPTQEEEATRGQNFDR